MTVGRLGHEARPTTPYEEPVWEALLAAGDSIDAKLRAAGLTLTTGGEPRWTRRLHPGKPEWNGDALGASKWEAAVALTAALKETVAPGALALFRQGKLYPGEPLPRWAIDLLARRDGEPWTEYTPTRPRSTSPTSSPDGSRSPSRASWTSSEPCTPPTKTPGGCFKTRPRCRSRCESRCGSRSPTETPAGASRASWIAGPTPRRALASRSPASMASGARSGSTPGAGSCFLPGDSPMGLRLPLASLTPEWPLPTRGGRVSAPGPAHGDGRRGPAIGGARRAHGGGGGAEAAQGGRRGDAQGHPHRAVCRGPRR